MTHYLYGEPRGKVVRLDNYRQAVEPDTMRHISEVIDGIMRKIEARRGEN